MAGPNDPKLTGADVDPNDVDPEDLAEQELADDRASADPTTLSLNDLDEAEASRPTLSDENADGFDEMEEEIRHQAEDLPIDAPGRR